MLLTLVGGASFRNPHGLILAELKRAHDMYASHPASQLEEVQLVLYEKSVAAHYERHLLAQTKAQNTQWNVQISALNG